MKSPLILEIKGNSLDDGPGIRSVVFFKGCPLDCTWCHNPESKQAGPEIGFEAGECVGCDSCIDSCREKALDRKNPFFIDRSKCTLCFACIANCPSGALRQIGIPMEIDRIVSGILRDKPFFDMSGGGATLSGGEPTLFTEFCEKLAASLRENRIHVLLETCGFFNSRRFEEQIYPWIDEIYFDIKLIDPEDHLRYCKVPNESILENFRRFHSMSRNGGIPVVPRIPLIPGITDTAKNMRAVADFLVSCGAEKARLLPYHPLWREKNRTIGIESHSSKIPDMDKWMDGDSIEACRSIFLQAGINL